MKDKKPVIFLLVIVVAGVYYLFGSNVSDKCGNPPLMSFFQQETLSTDGIWTFCSGQDGKMQKYKYDCSQITNYEWVKNITEEKGCCFSADYPKEELKCGDNNYLIQERFKCDTIKGVWVFDRWAESRVICPVETTGWSKIGTIVENGGCLFISYTCNYGSCEIGLTYDGIDPVWAEQQGIRVRSGIIYPITVINNGETRIMCHGSQCSTNSCNYAYGDSVGTSITFYYKGV